VSSYSPTDWVDGTTPLDEAHLDKIEQGIAAAYLRLPPSPTGQDGKWLTVAGGAMVWAAAPAGGGGGLDWEGGWLAPTAYVKGDVVTYGGVVYGAVNDSTGQTPPAASQFPVTNIPVALVTALPSSPFDGQEVVLVDSLSAPTYQWRFRYVAAKATNKWVFIGGAPAYAEVATTSPTFTSTSYIDTTPSGPSLAVPVAGLYVVEAGFRVMANSGGNAAAILMSYAIGATAAVDADATGFGVLAGAANQPGGLSRKRSKALTAVTLAAKFRVTDNTWTLGDRYLALTPQAVGG